MSTDFHLQTNNALPTDRNVSLLNKIKSELRAGEILLWNETAVPAFFTERTIPALIIAVPWVGFAVFFVNKLSFENDQSLNFGDMFTFLIFGIPFSLIALSLFLSPLFEFLKLRKTIYGITNKRAIKVENKRISSIQPSSIEYIEKVEDKNGIGSIYFASETRTRKNGKIKTYKIGFVRITKLKEAERFLLELQSKGNI